MSELEDFIDKDKANRKELERMIKKCQEFLEANGYEVHPEGQGYCKAAQHYHTSRLNSYGTGI
jgi:hypothetical protein